MATTAQKIAMLEDMLDRGITEMSRDGEVLKFNSPAEIKQRIAELRYKLTGKKRRPMLLRCRL